MDEPEHHRAAQDQPAEERAAAGKHRAPEPKTLPERQKLHRIITVAPFLFRSVRVVDDHGPILLASLR